ncbi:MAG: hypothetical protein AUH85_16370 [Chloroflexi bacterium 13_1_40CM_4_68_4]|nr:MAG: hypothetical protein AUH85_16370 [Chloroflexi bacterium 13_1_40CM_4_68_4]
MFGIGIEELVVILVIALFVLGPERLPSLARDVGKAVRELRRASDELTEEFLRADQPRPEPAPAPSLPASTPPTPEAGTEAAAIATQEPEQRPATPESTAVDDTTDFDRKAQEDADRARERGELVEPTGSGETPKEPERWG